MEPAAYDNHDGRHAVAGRPIAEALARRLDRELSVGLAPGLHVVATPIGNLADVSVRALATLAMADAVYCEDTRRSAILLDAYGIRVPLRSYHDHSSPQARADVLGRLRDGARLALVSDAGTPLICDPGYRLVREAIEQGSRVHVVPGASAALAAVAIAGLPTDRVVIGGFLPARASGRRERIAELAAIPATLVLFEAPQRLAESLADLAGGLGDREAVIARELTKLHEECCRGRLSELARVQREWIGEVVIVVGPPRPTVVSDAEIEQALATVRAGASLRDAARDVAAALGVPRSRVYEIGLRAKGER